jgi:SAM-dependent methyltransferase
MAELQPFDYDQHGTHYASFRRTDPRIAAVVLAALGPAKTVLNVGAGAGSYEPTDRYVLAVEPSAAMRAQRPPGAAIALAASAESLPFGDGAFDAAMAMMTVHHWPNRLMGLREMRRVARGPVLVFTCDPNAPTEFWIYDYAPEFAEIERRRYGSLDVICQALGGKCEVQPIPVARDCLDGFQIAYYARPEAFLDARVRNSQSAWKFLPPGVEQRTVDALARDLKSGDWDRRYGRLRTQPFVKCQLRLLIARPPSG